MNITLPLNKLILSPRNVRKTPVADVEIESMADSIASKGLLQNLVVSEGVGGKGIYEVDAGGCRLRALEVLVKRKAIARNHPVPCLVIPRDDAREASLAENAVQIAMNPADEVVAYGEIIAQYADKGILDRAEQIANLARRFGRTIAYVEQRLRLGDLAPAILDALRFERMTLDAAKAYAAYPDHKLQMKVFAAEEKKSEGWRHTAKAVRDTMAGKVYSLDHPAVIYVGLEDYRAAGGRVSLEMFMGTEDREVILDPSIIDRLAEKRTAEDAEHFAKEEGWAGGVVKPWSMPSWHDVKPPKGFKRNYRSAPSEMSEDQKAESVLVFKIAPDGSTLEPLTYCFVPDIEAAEKPGSFRQETPEEAAARVRRVEVERKAVRLAAPPVAGTPFEGRAFWPRPHQPYVPAIAEAEDEPGAYVVALLIKVPGADVEAAIAEAERRYDLELAELAEEEAALAAEQEGEASAEPSEEAAEAPAPEVVS